MLYNYNILFYREVINVARDPVCGMEVKPDDAAATYEYKGETYYFCAEGCKEKFADSPSNYLEEDGCCQ